MVLLLVVTVVFGSPCAIAAKVKTKEQARQKINHLKWLERVEHNKLYKNQQNIYIDCTNCFDELFCCIKFTVYWEKPV